SCEGGRSSRSDPFAGAAQSLVQQGLPAVVAMQFEITDDAAAVFAQEFYRSLADGYPVDAALAEGRRAIFATKTNAEWGIPVLFMRTEDGRIFDVQPPVVLPAPPPVTPAPVVSTAVQPQPQPQPQSSPVVEPPTIPIAPRTADSNEAMPASSFPVGTGVGWSTTISTTGSTPNDLRMVKIIGGVILGVFVVLALMFYLIFRNSTEQATPTALLPPVIEFFQVEPAEIVSGSGESAQVSWRVSGDVTGVVVSGPGIDPSLVLSRTGSLAIFPEQSATLRLTARNYDQAVSIQATVEVVQPTPAPVNAPTASLTDAYDATVTFNSVRIIDDCDGALTGLGEFWQDLAVNDQHLRWPETGTNEVDSGQSYAIGHSLTVRMADDERLVVTGAGFEVDEFQTESMGSIRVSHSAADDWGVGNDSQTSLAVCQFTLNYEIAASSKASTEPDDSQASEQATPLSGEVAFALTFDNLSAFPQPTAGPGGTSNLTTNDFRQAVAGDGAHFAAGRWARFPFREGDNLAFNPTAGELELWYKPDFAFNTEPFPRYLVVVGDVDNPPHLKFFHYGDLIFQLGVGLESGQFLEARSAKRFSALWAAGQPVHLRVVWDATSADPVQMYVDWVRVDDGTQPIQISNADFENVDYLYIGAASALGQNSAEGLLDELIIRR
ncbi:MAG: CHAT domain-containing protein, partial [Chloroflexi bacterium]